MLKKMKLNDFVNELKELLHSILPDNDNQDFNFENHAFCNVFFDPYAFTIEHQFQDNVDMLDLGIYIRYKKNLQIKIRMQYNHNEDLSKMNDNSKIDFNIPCKVISHIQKIIDLNIGNYNARNIILFNKDYILKHTIVLYDEDVISNLIKSEIFKYELTDNNSISEKYKGVIFK